MAKHDWESSSYQWGAVKGGRPGDAITWYRCKTCGASFAHRYNLQPNIYTAAAEQDVDFDDCPLGSQLEGGRDDGT